MKKEKKSESKPVQNAEEAVTPVLLARLAAKIAPALCLNEPRQAIEAAARLIQCAREWLPMPDAEDEEPSLADEKAQLKALAKHADKYGFKLAGGNLPLADAFALQKKDRFWKGKRREGPYKTEASFAAALRGEKLTFIGFPKGTEETIKNLVEGAGWTGEEALEETTEQAVEALFETIRERRLEKDNARKKRVN
jgi:hypothetical protein